MNSTFVRILFAATLTTGCTTVESYIEIKSVEAKPEECPLEIFMPSQKIDKKIDIIGHFSVQDMGLAVNCGWEDTLEKNKKYACIYGAEAIQFTSIEPPSARTTCYTSNANFIIFK